MASMDTQEPFPLLDPKDSPNPVDDALSWRKIQRVVKETRRLNVALANACRVPTFFAFRQVTIANEQKTRAYFLGVPQNSHSRENTLMYVDLPEHLNGSQGNIAETLKWNQLLDFQGVYLQQENFSKEEQLLRERKRLGSFGITSFDVDIRHGKFIFPASSTLFVCEDRSCSESDTSSSRNAPTIPMELKRKDCKATRMDAKLCPVNPELVAYVADKDIWVSHIPSGNDYRLTFAHEVADGGGGDNGLSAGAPSFVIQEEFDRYTGYWWQPVCIDGVYRILYEEVDEREVSVINLVCPSSGGSEVEKHRYPRAGEYNAASILKLLEFKLNEYGEITELQDKEIDDPEDFVGGEYLVRTGWCPDAASIWAQVLNRSQSKLETYHIPLECFKVMAGHDEDGASSSAEEIMEVEAIRHRKHHITALYADESDIWVNVSDAIYFLPRKEKDVIEFITASEKSNYRHLYHVKSSLARNGLQNHKEPVILQEVQLTSGDWEVMMNKEIWVDESRELIYFMGMKDTPLESHLYVVSYSKPQEVVRLTEPGFSHTVHMDKECRMFVSVYSSIDQPPSCVAFRLEHPAATTPKSSTAPAITTTHKLCTLMQSSGTVGLGDIYCAPSLFTYQSTSSQLPMHGMVFRPHKMEAGKKYPTVLYVYGGPQVQIVSNSFKGMRYLRLQTMASLGYVVVAIDSRGSCSRGLQFEAWIKNRLGTVEIDDQIEGLMWLASEVDYIDLDRVAIHGSSYGGYLSLMGLVQKPDVFKVAIAGAPVTQWELYDAGYTERYMGTPDSNLQGYTQGSLLTHVRRFPDEPGRVLIVHGLMDENVHFYHTSSLIDELIKQGKPYQLQVYPNERHGIRNLEASEHYETLTLHMLQNSL